MEVADGAIHVVVVSNGVDLMTVIAHHSLP
jgi:hypothetical protein